MTAIELGRPLATRFVPSTGSTAMSTSYVAAAELLADVEHRRLVALAFADDDAAGDLHLVERFAHRLDGGAVGDVAFAAAHPT